MTYIMIVVGFVLAAAILGSIPKLPGAGLRAAAAIGALVVFIVFFTLSSFRLVGENEIGVVVKEVGSKSLPAGKIIATNGEKGPQAKILPPGWHPWLWPMIYKVETLPLIEVPPGKVAILNANDGLSLPPGEIYAPEWDATTFKRMAEDATYFLTEGGGYKGPQSSVLTPGKYRINPKLFTHTVVEVTNVEKATVGIVKSNVGGMATAAPGEAEAVVEKGMRGIWRQPLLPQEYYLNTDAYEVTMISTAKRVVRFTKAGGKGEQQEITVRSSDGFTFPVDVRIEYEITPHDAALVVAVFGDDKEQLIDRLNSAVRAIFRNNAESVKALSYVQQRSEQESQSLVMLSEEMSKVGVTVTAVRIGDVGDEATLGNLLKTQMDREIALQEQETFKEQQRAAEQQKELSKTEQEAEEEKRLATATYEVKIAEQDKEKRIIEAGAEAEAIKIKAAAQADAYKLVAEQIGKGNAALVELLKIIGESNIQITPRVMVVGSGSGSGTNAETTALIGTMLDSMVSKEEPDEEE
jgi:uncharacterized membrane protein YqiK